MVKFRFPPKAWFRARKDRLLTDCLREYYEQHPEHAPPAGWNYSDWCANEARLGDPAPLIGLLGHSCNGLSAAAKEVIVEALQAKKGKRGNGRLREFDDALIVMRVGDRVKAGMRVKTAVAEVMHLHNCSRSHIFKALKQSGNGRR